MTREYDPSELVPLYNLANMLEVTEQQIVLWEKAGALGVPRKWENGVPYYLWGRVQKSVEEAQYQQSALSAMTDRAAKIAQEFQEAEARCKADPTDNNLMVWQNLKRQHQRLQQDITSGKVPARPKARTIEDVKKDIAYRDTIMEGRRSDDPMFLQAYSENKRFVKELADMESAANK